MIEAFKTFFGSTAEPQKMAGGAFTIMGPLPKMSELYDMERAVRKLKLTGWMQLSHVFNIHIEVYGTFDSILTLIKQMDHGTILHSRPLYEMMWLPYQSTYSAFEFKIFKSGAGKSH